MLFGRKCQKTRVEIAALENKLKILEENLDCIFDFNYLDYKSKINQIYEKKDNSVKIRSQCAWC